MGFNVLVIDDDCENLHSLRTLVPAAESIDSVSLAWTFKRAREHLEKESIHVIMIRMNTLIPGQDEFLASLDNQRVIQYSIKTIWANDERPDLATTMIKIPKTAVELNTVIKQACKLQANGEKELFYPAGKIRLGKGAGLTRILVRDIVRVDRVGSFCHVQMANGDVIKTKATIQMLGRKIKTTQLETVDPKTILNINYSQTSLLKN